MDGAGRVRGCWNSPHQSSGYVKGQPPSSGRTVAVVGPSGAFPRTVAIRGGKRWHSPRFVSSVSQLSQKRHPLQCSMFCPPMRTGMIPGRWPILPDFSQMDTSGTSVPMLRGLPRRRSGLDVEQAEDLFPRQAQLLGRPILLDQLVEQRTLLLQHLRDAPLDAVLDQEARHEDRLALADAMGPLDRLVLDGRVPPAIEQEHIV